MGDADDRQEVEGLLAANDQQREICEMSAYRYEHPVFGMMNVFLKIKIIPLKSRVRFMRTAIELLIDEDVTMWWINKGKR